MRNQAHMRFHLAAATVVTMLGFALSIGPGDWLAIALCCGLVLSMEQMNTAIEAAVDRVSFETHPLAKAAKDAAAGAVLFAAATAVAVGLVVFVPRLAALLR
jgi:diacylglycerol kinase